MPNSTKILFIGDVVGSLGRKAVKELVPQWQKKYQPDLIIANVENLAHGKGVTPKTLNEVKEAGVEIFTGGNHIWSKYDPKDLIEYGYPLATPANDSRSPKEYISQSKDVNGQEVVVINLVGQTFMEDPSVTNPFHKVDSLLKDISKDAIVLVDMHAEATSEKMAMGLYLDGRVSAVLGTHTHVPTADQQIMENGTAYVTDVGMVGPYPSVLGIKKEIIIDKFLTETRIKHELPESGQIEVNAVLLDIDNESKKAKIIETIRQIID